jgi:hypothetical protein
MTDDELAAVIAAATALLQRQPGREERATLPPWRIAARIGIGDAADTRAAARSASLWSMTGRLRG